MRTNTLLASATAFAFVSALSAFASAQTSTQKYDEGAAVVRPSAAPSGICATSIRYP